MKTYLTYGFAMAIAGALLSLVLYFLGYHSDPAKFATAQIATADAVAPSTAPIGVRAPTVVF